MVPNAESALNEEAGMLLLEDYDAYFKKAALMTKIHAIPVSTKLNSSKVPPAKRLETAVDQNDRGPSNMVSSGIAGPLAEMRKKLKRL